MADGVLEPHGSGDSFAMRPRDVGHDSAHHFEHERELTVDCVDEPG
jgi:hypothetical protein